MEQLLFMLVLTALLQAPTESRDQSADSCASCHAALMDDTAPGMHPVSAGCMSCHSPHEIKEGKLFPTKPPTNEQCLDCHSEVEESAPHKMKGTLSELQRESLAPHSKAADLSCIACHKLHYAKSSDHLLALPQQDSRLCLTCHPDFGSVLSGVHDLRKSAPTEKNLQGQTPEPAGPCSACHMVHGPARKVMKNDIDTEGTCITCHHAGGPGSKHSGEPFVHPAPVDCLTCHDPHQDSTKSAKLLRKTEDGEATAICLECHDEMSPIQKSLHNRRHLGKTQTETDCGGCHAIHGPAPDWTGGTWIAPVAESSHPQETHRCTGCHNAKGGLKDVVFRLHPALPMGGFQKASDAGFLPLVDPSGRQGTEGVIGCITCHVSHGRPEGGGFVPPDWKVTPEALIHAAKPMLRPFVAPNLCSSCHGPDGLRLFLEFHHPAKSNPSSAR